MLPTELIYLTAPMTRCARARVVTVERYGGSLAVLLNRTPAYPQGGGQPSDVGIIQGAGGAVLRVNRVIRGAGGAAMHLGDLEHGDLAEGENVSVTIDWEKRREHARLHTAGELICAGVFRLGHDWRMSAASHFPGQARVAFAAEALSAQTASFASNLESTLRDLVAEDAEIAISSAASPEELAALCPTEAGKPFANWPIRMVSPTPGFWRPCLGTHCERAGEVGEIVLKKVRMRSGEVSVSYTVSASREAG